MLGEAQKSWLRSALQTSKAQWKCVLNEAMMMRLALSTQQLGSGERLPLNMLRQPFAVNAEIYVSVDAWDGYPSERTELLPFVAD
jgi:alkaline phosphatase D